MSFPLWMALARATPVEGWRLDDAQAPLCGDGDGDGGAAAPLPQRDALR
jgi:hypothetical protein